MLPFCIPDLGMLLNHLNVTSINEALILPKGPEVIQLQLQIPHSVSQELQLATLPTGIVLWDSGGLGAGGALTAISTV